MAGVYANIDHIDKSCTDLISSEGRESELKCGAYKNLKGKDAPHAWNVAATNSPERSGRQSL
jgi:hypothetical protein